MTHLKMIITCQRVEQLIGVALTQTIRRESRGGAFLNDKSQEAMS